jgi:serine/threonine protein kinase
MPPPKKYPKSLRKKGALRTVARCYAETATMQPKEYWNDVCPIEWGVMEKYEVMHQLGKGKYGEVFEGIDLDSDARCVVKIMRPVKEQRLKREIKILRHVRGGPNIVSLVDLVRDPDTKTPCFVFELVEAVPLRELQGMVTDVDVRHYMYQLLQALDFTHSRGIMHRDVKVRPRGGGPAAGCPGVGWGEVLRHSLGLGSLAAWQPRSLHLVHPLAPPLCARTAAGQRADRPLQAPAEAHRLGPRRLLLPRQGVPRPRGALRRAVGCGRRAGGGGLWAAGGGRRAAGGGRRTADGGRRTADGGRRTADGGRRAAFAAAVLLLVRPADPARCPTFLKPLPRPLIATPHPAQATRFYKGPELLLDIRDYDYSLDIWCVGCMLAAFLFKRQVRSDGVAGLGALAAVASSATLPAACAPCWRKHSLPLQPPAPHRPTPTPSPAPRPGLLPRRGRV